MSLSHPAPSSVLIAGWALALVLPWATAQAQTVYMPSTAAEIEQALQAPAGRSERKTRATRATRATRSSRSTERGPGRVVKDTFDDPEDFSQAPPTADYQLLDGLPTARARIHFATNSARLHPDASRLLDQYAIALQRGLSDAVVVVAGHTDSVGSQAHNWELSRRRAQSVKNFLTGAGVDPRRLVVKAYGESQPIASNRTAAGRALNRRGEFIRIDTQ